jgi:hypothetical protein
VDKGESDKIQIKPDLDRKHEDNGHVHLAYNPSYSACFFSQNSIFLSQKSANSVFQPAYNFSRTGPIC